MCEIWFWISSVIFFFFLYVVKYEHRLFKVEVSITVKKNVKVVFPEYLFRHCHFVVVCDLAKNTVVTLYCMFIYFIGL